MTTNVKQMIEAATAVVPRITPAQAKDLIAKGDTLIIDVRDAPEVAKSRKISGAVNVSRGMLEFRADAETPYYDLNFEKGKTIIPYCGYTHVYNLGGFKGWAENGGAVEPA